MAAREMLNEPARQLLAVGEDVQANFDAIAKKTEITEVARILRSIGDIYNTKLTVEYHQAVRSSQTSRLNRFIQVVDATLEWLEHSGQTYGQKQEQVLRALYNLTGRRPNYL